VLAVEVVVLGIFTVVLLVIFWFLWIVFFRKRYSPRDGYRLPFTNLITWRTRTRSGEVGNEHTQKADRHTRHVIPH
jgi:hypothetical protein